MINFTSTPVTSRLAAHSTKPTTANSFGRNYPHSSINVVKQHSVISNDYGGTGNYMREASPFMSRRNQNKQQGFDFAAGLPSLNILDSKYDMLQ